MPAPPNVACPTCGAAPGAPCRALGRVGTQGSSMGSSHAKRKRAALALARKASSRGLTILPRPGRASAGRSSTGYRPTDPSTWTGRHRIIEPSTGRTVDERQYPPSSSASTKRADEVRAGDAIFDATIGVWRGVRAVRYFRQMLGAPSDPTWSRQARGQRVTIHFEDGGSFVVDGSTVFAYSVTGLRGWTSAKHSEAYAGRYSPKRSR